MGNLLSLIQRKPWKRLHRATRISMLGLHFTDIAHLINRIAPEVVPETTRLCHQIWTVRRPPLTITAFEAGLPSPSGTDPYIKDQVRDNADAIIFIVSAEIPGYPEWMTPSETLQEYVLHVLELGPDSCVPILFLVTHLTDGDEPTSTSMSFEQVKAQLTETMMENKLRPDTYHFVKTSVSTSRDIYAGLNWIAGRLEGETG